MASRPSRAADGDVALTPRPLPAVPPGLVIRAVLGLHGLLRRLVDRLVPAELLAFELVSGAALTALLGFLARHRIADLLAERAMTGDEVAAHIGADADVVHRVLRAAAVKRIVLIDGAGRFRNGRVAAAMRSGQAARSRDFVEYFASTSNVAAWNDLEGTARSGKNAFERVHGMSVWDWFDAHPDERETFARAMMGMTIQDAPTVAGLFPFGEVKVVCDVGGGRGTLLSELLIRHRHLRGILYDGAGVIESARSLLAARGVADRVQLEAGSFFERVPAGADAYLLKNILHDWDDARSLTILGAVRRAAQPGQRVLIVESLLERNQVDLAALADVQMMMVCGEGRERSRADFARLLTAAGFRVGRIAATPLIAVVEGIAA